LQRKQEQLAKTQKQNALLAELDALDISAQSVAHGENIDALSEPLSTHPLWHRVDHQFWWNEHLLKPFIDAKVLTISLLKFAPPDSPPTY
jgi:phosphatidylinositol 4-phosphatase